MINGNDFEFGQVIRVQFPTRSGPQLTNLFQNSAGDGDPVFVLRNRKTNVDIVNGPPTVTINKRYGIHELVWDTSKSSDAAINADYDLVITDGRVSADGTVNNWVDVTNDSPLGFALQNSSAGFVLQRSVKVQTFQVDDVVNDSRIIITGQNLNLASDAYELQNVAWAPGAANFGSGYVVRSSSDAGGNRVLLVMQRPFAVTPVVGDAGYLLPEERPAEQYWANIEAEWLPEDKYAAIWYNGTEARSAEDTPKITVVRISDGAIVVGNQDMSLVPNSSPPAYEYRQSTVLVPANDVAQITVSATIDGVLRVYSRIYPHAA